MSEPNPPSNLNTDEEWAKLCAWLKANRLRFHIPRRSAPYMTIKGLKDSGTFQASVDA